MQFIKATSAELQETKNNFAAEIKETSTLLANPAISEDFKQHLQERLEWLEFNYNLFK